jgi:hypothetical protein
MNHETPTTTGQNMIKVPSEEVLTEIDAALERDDTRLGDVFRRKRDGQTNSDIARSVGASTHGWVTNYNGFVDTIRTGKVPDGASRRRDTLGAVQSFAERHRQSLSIDALSWLGRVTAALSKAGDVRPDVNDRDWVSGTAASGRHYQTLQVDADVYRMLVDQQRPGERTLNDTLRRILT